MLTKKELLNKLLPFIEQLRKGNTVAAAYLFGSYAVEKQNALSDIDIAVLLHSSVSKEHYFPERLRLLGELSCSLNTNAVDLVILNEAPPALGYRVTKDGEILFASEKSESQIVNYKVRVWDRYFDYQPTQKLFSAGLAKRIQEGRFSGR